MAVTYRVENYDAFTVPDTHQHKSGDTYVAPKNDDLDALDVAGVIDVLEWGDKGNGHGTQDEPETYDGRPEPVRSVEQTEDGEVVEKLQFVVPDSDESVAVDGNTRLRRIDVGTWRCEQCNTKTKVPHFIGSEDLQDPGICEGCEKEGPFTHIGISEAELRKIFNGKDIWRLPTGVEPDGYGNLWDDVKNFIATYWDAKENEIYEGLTAFALSTWVRDNLDFVPHLMLIGKTTGGKTRLLNTLARVSYRGIVSASATPSSMFRMIDAYDVSFMVSEYHGLEYETRVQVDNVIRSAQKRGELVTRSEPAPDGFEPMTFDPFTHAAIATQYDVEDDIKNRCIQVRSTPSDGDPPATFDEGAATELRNRLLYMRYRLVESDEWANARASAYQYMSRNDIVARSREKLLPMTTAAIIWDKLEVLEPFIDRVLQQDQEAASESEDARFTKALKNLAHDRVGQQAFIGEGDPYAALSIPYSDIVAEFENMFGEEKSPSWVGHIRKRLGFDKTSGRDGTAIQDPQLREKLQKLIKDHNLEPLSDKDGDMPQGTKRELVLNIIDELQSAGNDPHMESVKQAAMDRGMSQDEAEHAISELRKKGAIYEPSSGLLRTN
jgi:hypothetical protein